MVRKASKPKISAARAQDWISSVLNPIVEGLRREVSLVASPLRWLPEARDFEYVHEIPSYVGQLFLDNYEDFLEKHPDLRPELRRHDAAVVELRETVAVSYDALSGDRPFRTALRLSTAGRSLSELEQRDVMAYIASGYEHLPPSVSIHKVYNKLPLEVRAPPLLHNLKGKRMARAQTLGDIALRLHERLVKLRTSIADQYGARIQPVH